MGSVFTYKQDMMDWKMQESVCSIHARLSFPFCADEALMVGFLPLARNS